MAKILSPLKTIINKSKRDFDHKPWPGYGSLNLLKCACVDNEMIEHTLVCVWFGQYGCNQKRTTAVLLP